MPFPQAQIVDRTAIKPIYIIVAEDPQAVEGIAYYKSQDINECGTFLEFRGCELTKTQAAKLTKDPHAQLSTKSAEIKLINRKLPWHRVIRIENITYNKTPQGEKND